MLYFRILSSLFAVCLALGACSATGKTPPLSDHRPSRLHAQSGSAIDEMMLSLEAPESPLVKAPKVPSLGRRSRRLQVLAPNLDIYPSPRARREVGAARIGTVLPARRAKGRGCKGGRWFKINAGSYVCVGKGDARVIRAGKKAPPLPAAVGALRPGVRDAMPFDYGKMSRNPLAPRLERLPRNKRELAALRDAIAGDGRLSRSLLDRWLDGTYLVAIARKVEHLGESFMQTSDGKWVLADQVSPKPEPQMVGQPLGRRGSDLPLALIPEEATVFCQAGTSLRECGRAEKWARAEAVAFDEVEGKELVELQNGALIDRADVRIARAIKRPNKIPADARWVHVHLDEQVLVAYEGDEPRYATLISSGLPGVGTRTINGTWQIERSYLTKTMRGKDDAGRYEVQEVPWAMYYHQNFALHGAYWHSTFGNPRSHGCVNIPPFDARWLFYWLDAEPPAGWHEIYSPRGGWVHVSGATRPVPPEATGDDAEAGGEDTSG